MPFQAILRLEEKVDMAVEMPILEFGRDAQAIFRNSLRSLYDRLDRPTTSARGSQDQAHRSIAARAFHGLQDRSQRAIRRGGFLTRGRRRERRMTRKVQGGEWEEGEDISAGEDVDGGNDEMGEGLSQEWQGRGMLQGMSRDVSGTMMKWVGVLKGRRAERKLRKEAGEVVEGLGRRLDGAFARHVDALGQYFVSKFEDRLQGIGLVGLGKWEKQVGKVRRDVLRAFEKAAKCAVPEEVAGRWDWRSVRDGMAREVEDRVVDRRMQVEVFVGNGEEDRWLGQTKSWWKKLALKVLVTYINYLQTQHALKAARRAAKRRQEEYPPFPIF